MSNTTPVSARARIDAILDDNSFVEIGAGVKARATDFNITKNAAPSDGVITGYGVINGNLVYVYSQDAAVMNRISLLWAVRWAKCMQRRLKEFMIWH